MKEEGITKTLKKNSLEVANYPCKMILTLWLVLMTVIDKKGEIQQVKTLDRSMFLKEVLQ
jgi:hypothetical protein